MTSLRPSRDGKALLVRLYWAGDTIDVPAWGVITLRAGLPE